MLKLVTFNTKYAILLKTDHNMTYYVMQYTNKMIINKLQDE